MNSERQKAASEKKKVIQLTSVALVALVLTLAAGFFILSKIQKSSPQVQNTNQEQFVGQAETSQQLQAECQSSASALVKTENLQQALAEFKKHVENCREVYFIIDAQSSFRTEGMYPDLIIDLISKIAATNKEQAIEVLNYAKSLVAWQYYMGPVICDSHSVLLAYEESLMSNQEKTCIKIESFNEKILSQLKNRNFSILVQTMPLNHVAWLGSPEADAGCPSKISNIIKTAKAATENGIQIKEDALQPNEANEISVIFRTKADEDKLVLEFANNKGCLELKAALVAGLQTNE